MPVCEIDLRVGGAYRYVWNRAGEKDMGVGGIFREIVSPERLVATERFDESWYPGDALDTTVFSEAGKITKVTCTVLYESKEARDTARTSEAILSSPVCASEGGLMAWKLVVPGAGHPFRSKVP